MIFENIIGNEKNKKLLEDIITKNKIANAYMFIGQESIGKFLFAKEFAKSDEKEKFLKVTGKYFKNNI